MVTNNEHDSRAAQEPPVDDMDDEPTEEQILLNIREALRQALAGETIPFDEWLEEIRRENAVDDAVS